MDELDEYVASARQKGRTVITEKYKRFDLNRPRMTGPPIKIYSFALSMRWVRAQDHDTLDEVRTYTKQLPGFPDEPTSESDVPGEDASV